MVWARDWVHLSASANTKPDDAMMLELLLDWVEDEAPRCRILVANPAAPYGFVT